MDNKQSKQSNSNLGYEARDVSIKPVVWFLVGLSVFLILSMVGTAIFYNTSEQKKVAEDMLLTPVEYAQMAPDDPRLQPNPADDLATLREKEDAVLNNYGWVDKSNNIVHIPIDLAMKLALEQGYPVREGQ